VILVALIGLFPETFAGTTVRFATAAVLQAPLPEFRLAIWHGWTPAVTMSAIAIVVGCGVLLAFGGIRKRWARLWLPAGKSIFDAFVDALAATSRAVGSGLHNGSLQRYLFAMIATTLLM